MNKLILCSGAPPHSDKANDYIDMWFNSTYINVASFQGEQDNVYSPLYQLNKYFHVWFNVDYCTSRHFCLLFNFAIFADMTLSYLSTMWSFYI